ncbi:hypothetical protein Q8W71_07070 [Methylobacterium sp. NEAU 140]|uniref:DUF6883 domain-containing protein n=1 Tax=Methylobacterium sp. NEAU 140 TaxID=3064945 RepID=UPI0027340BF7|nr:DUF6883 domain-containing protein [Methylobacterium sp. NEAU 140]MDP4022377.1 hypothetical protein [Methylobacterium sp. NEAU 140]
MTDAASAYGFTVEQAKVTRYLLNVAHAEGGSKAKYLLRFGFTPDDPQPLVVALVRHAIANFPTGRRVQPPKGLPRLVFEGPSEAPDGRRMHLRTVWEVTAPTELRFITAVPLTR